MLTKLLRARAWAVELKKLTPELQHEVDQFLETTAACPEMQAEFVRDTQRMFNGGGSLIRFLARRKPESELAERRSERDGSYRVGGRTALFELRAACEVFVAQIDQEFFRKKGPEEFESAWRKARADTEAGRLSRSAKSENACCHPRAGPLAGC